MNAQSNLGTALITGASSGIGAVYADRLAKRGYDLVLVARDESRLRELSKQLHAVTGRGIEVLRADLTQKADLKRIEQLLQNDPHITLLVNNAGTAVAKPLIESDPEQVEQMITLNVLALTRLSRAAASAFAKRGSGALINIASVVALAPGLVGGAYSATKSFVLNLTQALHQELKGKGVRIQAVLPGATGTELWERAGVDLKHLPSEILMSTGDMVDAALVGFDRNEPVTIPSLPNAQDWDAFEAARVTLGPNLSHSKPASRYVQGRAA
jgi:short-subunit dehydrogenase